MRKRIILKILNELASNKKYFILSLLISIYVFLPQIFIYTSLKQILGILASFFILFFISKVSKVIFLFVSLFTLLISSLLLHIAIHWGSSGITSRIELALLSPNHEMSEYLLTYLNLTDVFIIFYFLFGVYLLYRLLIGLHHTYKILKVSSLLLLLLLILLHNSYYNLSKRIVPYKYVEKVIAANEWKSIVDKRKEYLKKHEKLKYTFQKRNLLYDKIIIIIGEAVNKKHMGIYDYNISTTPFLSNLLQQKNSFKFDVIAPTNQTRFSVPIALTDATVKHFYDFITSRSIISDLKEYGYKTYWLSNQFVVGKHETYISSIASEADYIKIRNSKYLYEMSGVKFDIVLLDYLKQINLNNNDKEVYFFHLLGSHTQYSKRYPTTNALFPNPKNIIEEYDNTIFYTDHIINEIYNKFKDKKLLFIYLSDHGEVVNIKKNGHGSSLPYQDEYDIPLIIHSSEHNEKLLKLKIENEKHLFNMEDFNHIVQYLTGIDNNIKEISHNSKVFTVEPINIIDYRELNKFE